MAYIVEAPNDWYMKGRTWTSQKNTATVFDTEEAAKAGIAKAGEFHKKKTIKTWKIVSTAE